MIRSAALAAFAHGFFTRAGGVSTGIYASLNCGYGSHDDAAAVRANRARVAAMLGVAETGLITAYQIHSSDVVTATRPWTHEVAPKADAMVTRVPGLALGILTADCAPVLLADADAGVVGAAHCGWRGALAGVVEATVAAMCALGATRPRIAAAIGPCIGARSYEVGEDLRARFVAAAPDHARYFAPGPRPEKHLFDLQRFVHARLVEAGIGTVETVAADTLMDEARFFSYRRAVQRKDADYGRCVSAIALAQSR